MVDNKQKLIASAQKLIQRGQLDKAINEYQKILDADPNDSGTQLKIAALLARLDRKTEAIKKYVCVAEVYTKAGLLTKAIAAYKAALQVDYTQVALYEKLGDLSEKLGLNREAITQYKNVAFIYEKNGEINKVIEIIKKMCQLDPTNLGAKAKLACLLYQQESPESKETGLRLYREVVAALKEQNRTIDLANFYKKMLTIVPSDIMAKEFPEFHSLEPSEPSNDQLNKPDEETLNLLAKAYRQLGKKKIISALDRLLRVRPKKTVPKIPGA